MTFRTDQGDDVPSITADHMREVDRIAIQETGPNLFQMMENAGRNLASLALDKLGSDWRLATVVVLAGPGGNGGGGICAARHLVNRGVDVWLCLSSPDRLNGVPAFQRKIFHAAGKRETKIEKIKKIHPKLVLDALIGYNLRGAPRGSENDLIQWANGTESAILSLDTPSGLETTRGATPGVVIKPKWTLTLALPKTGLLAEKTGALFLADIGIPTWVYQKIGVSYKTPFDRRYVIPLHPGP